MHLKRVIYGLVLLAIALALVQFFIGLRTDEAKYLLNIPYPHPPFLRSIFGWTDGFIGQELFWRLVLSLCLILSGLLIHGLDRVAGLLAWVTAPAALLASGTVMLAPITAMYAVLLLWVLAQDEEKILHPALIGVLWMGMLFSAYQSLLLAPLVLGILRRKQTGWPLSFTILGLPILLLVLFTASHPLSAASFILQGTKDADLTVATRLHNALNLWLLAGGTVATIAGLIGLIRSKNIWVLGSFLLFSLYVFLGSFLYYAIFFVPFFAWGIATFAPNRILRLSVIVGSILTLGYFQPWPHASVARDVLPIIEKSSTFSTLIISGPFGHEWQYESSASILRFQEGMRIPAKSLLLCTQGCTLDEEAWQKIAVDLPEGLSVWKPTDQTL